MGRDQERKEEKRDLEAQLRDAEASKASKLAEAGPLSEKHAKIQVSLIESQTKHKELEVSRSTLRNHDRLEGLTCPCPASGLLRQEAVVAKAQLVVETQNTIQHREKQSGPAELAAAQAESDLETVEAELIDWTAQCVSQSFRPRPQRQILTVRCL